MDVRNSLWITFMAILDQYRFLFVIFYKMAAWPFWMFENHIRSHFWPFQIDEQLFNFLEIFYKMAAFFWMSEIHFRSYFWPFQIDGLILFEILDKMADVGHFGCPKFTLNHISGHFRSIQIFYFCVNFFYKLAAGGHFGCPKFTLDHISGHFRSIHIFYAGV